MAVPTCALYEIVGLFICLTAAVLASYSLYRAYSIYRYMAQRRFGGSPPDQVWSMDLTSRPPPVVVERGLLTYYIFLLLLLLLT